MTGFSLQDATGSVMILRLAEYIVSGVVNVSGKYLTRSRRGSGRKDDKLRKRARRCRV